MDIVDALAMGRRGALGYDGLPAGEGGLRQEWGCGWTSQAKAPLWRRAPVAKIAREVNEAISTGCLSRLP
jgi:hypothetical protein